MSRPKRVNYSTIPEAGFIPSMTPEPVRVSPDFAYQETPEMHRMSDATHRDNLMHPNDILSDSSQSVIGRETLLAIKSGKIKVGASLRNYDK